MVANTYCELLGHSNTWHAVCVCVCVCGVCEVCGCVGVWVETKE